jgi:hypothetical protein
MVIELSGPQQVRVQEPIDTLRVRLRGELIQPGDESYDAARTVFWGSIDRGGRR